MAAVSTVTAIAFTQTFGNVLEHFIFVATMWRAEFTKIGKSFTKSFLLQN